MRQQTATTGRQDELLERSSQFAALGEILAAVSSTHSGRLVLVGGEAGVGKTAFVRRFCEEHEPPARVLWGACDALFTPGALGPLLEVAEAVGGEFEELVISGGVRPHQVAAAIGHELIRRRPTFLVLEDLHWADAATLDVLRLLGRRITAVPALVIATYRDDELDRAHPLQIALGDLASRPSVERLRLEPLSPEAIAVLAAPHAVDAGELHRTTGGNPFFVTEALAAGEQRIPPTVRDAVLARAARLSPDARSLLEVVAITPRRVEPWLLEILAEGDVDSLEECLGSGMLTAEPRGVAFRHELARLAFEERIPPSRRFALHRAALEALSAEQAGRNDPARLAHHAEAAGIPALVLLHAPAAAERASSAGAHREAAAHYGQVLQYADELPKDQLARLLELASYESYLLDRYDDSIQALERAVLLRRELDDQRGEGEALRMLSERLWCPGRVDDSERVAHRGELSGVGPVAAARAEVDWLGRDVAAVAPATDGAVQLAVRLGVPWDAGELACWRRRAGIEETIALPVPEPHALQLAGEHRQAAALWAEMGCPYEAALALSDGDDEQALRDALQALQDMTALPAAAIVARRLRERGARGLPRGPRQATRRNAANLTAREVEVLGLLAEGLSNAAIAERLVVSTRTVDSHVSSILHKLDVSSRGAASAEAARRGLLAQVR